MLCYIYLAGRAGLLDELDLEGPLESLLVPHALGAELRNQPLAGALSLDGALSENGLSDLVLEDESESVLCLGILGRPMLLCTTSGSYPPIILLGAALLAGALLSPSGVSYVGFSRLLSGFASNGFAA